MKFLNNCLLLLLFLVTFTSSSFAQDNSKNISSEIYASVDAAVPGQSFEIALKQTLRQGWHSYWKNPGDSGIPLTVNWGELNGIEIGEFHWPTPETHKVKDIIDYGYEDDFTLLATVSVPEDFEKNMFVLEGSVTSLVCKEICIPETQNIALGLPIKAQANSVNASIFEEARDALPAIYSGDVNVSQDDTHLNIRINPALAGLANTDNAYIYPEEWGLMVNGDVPIIETDNGSIVTLRFDRGARDISEINGFSGVLVYDHNGEERAFQLETEATETPSSGGTQYADLSTLPSDSQEISGIAEDNLRPETRDVEFIGLLPALLFAFIGGLILNLMPCVFPVLSMKALGFVALSSKEKKEATTHGLLYTAGVIVSMLCFASALLILKAAGNQIGWGFQLQDPLVITALFWLFFAIGLNLLGLYEVPQIFSNIGSRFVSGHGYFADFMTGVLAVIVATPCTAPFMAVALGYALIQPTAITLLIFATLGLGLAFPFLLLALSPPLQRFMPKPGAWMETFRQILSFPMFMAAIWLVWVLTQQTGPNGAGAALIGALLIGFIVWCLSNLTRIVKWVLIILAVISVFYMSHLAMTSESPKSSEITPANMMSYTPEHLEAALAELDRPVFVNMTAAWCITCKVNEKTTLKSARVETLFEDNNVIHITGDWTSFNGDITAYLESFGRSGVPLYVYYPAADATGIRPDPVTLPQILSPEIVAETVDNP